MTEFTQTRGIDTLEDLIIYGGLRIEVLEKELCIEERIDRLEDAINDFGNRLKDVRDQDWIVPKDASLAEVTMAQYDAAVTLSTGIQGLIDEYIDELPVGFQIALIQMLNEGSKKEEER